MPELDDTLAKESALKPGTVKEALRFPLFQQMMVKSARLGAAQFALVGGVGSQ